MASRHEAYEDVARDRRSGRNYREGYAEAHRALLIGQAVRERRLALGLSQTELAKRAGMTQPAFHPTQPEKSWQCRTRQIPRTLLWTVGGLRAPPGVHRWGWFARS